jgi:hypothetical protein
MGKNPCALALLVLALALSAATTSFAQGTTSRVTGVVTDNTGAAVAGATVTLTNEGTSSSVTTQTSESGSYTFDLIQPGTYTIAVEKQGFKRFISKQNAALVNQPTTINAALEIGDVSADVTVIGSAEQVQTSTSGNIGSTIDQRTLEALPIVGLRGRNPLDLLNYQPGIVSGANTGGGVHVNGSRDRSFNFTLDGIDINESTAGGSNFTPLRPNPDSIQEFQVVTSNFTAELGRSSGAQVTFVTRSGTNEFHGNLFEYYQTPRFNAKSYPETIAKAPKGQFVQHIFGGSFGGPIPNFGFGEGTRFKLLKDKAFFFMNLQFLRAYDTALVNRTVYTQTARTGLFRYVVGRANAPAGTSTAAVDFAGNPILPACSATITTLCIATYNIATQAPVTRDATLVGYLNDMPLPNSFSGGSGCSPDGLNTACFSFGSPQHERQYDLTTKVDFKFNTKHSAFIRYARGDQNSFGDSANGGRPIFPNSPNFVDTYRTPRNLALQWRWSPTATVTNEFLYGRSQYFFKFETPTPDPLLPFAFLTVVTPNTNFTYNARGVTTDQFIDNLTIVHGSHTLKGGINFRFNLHKDDRSSVAGTAIEPIVAFSTASGFAGYNLPAAGTASINASDLTTLQNAIVNQIGKLGNISQAFIVDPSNPNVFAPAGTRWLNRAHYSEYDFYFQDNWRFLSNLVFDLGVRWEIKAQPKIDDRLILVPDQPVKVGAPPSNTLKWVEGDLFDTDFGKILPSVGFAWDPFKSGKTSIRANYRLASDRFATFLFGSSIFQSTLGNTIGATNGSFGPGGGLYRNVGPVIAALVPTQTPVQARQPASFGALSTNVIDPDLQFPQIHEWSLSFQRSIGKSNVLEVNYIGKHAVHLLGGYNVNQVNIFAGDPRCGGQTFVQAFIQAQDAMNTATNCLASLLTGGTTSGNSATFRSQFSADLANGNVATSAQTLARRSGATSLTTLGFSPFFFQPYPQFNAGLLVFDSNDYSRYDGLQIIGRRRMTNGLGFQIGYTLSKSKDNRSWDPSLSTVNTGNSQAGSATPFDLRDRSLNYAYSDFDRRHVIQGTYVYELPFGKGKWLSPGNSVLNYIVEGWQLAGATVYMTGRPFTVYSGRLTLGNIIQTPANCDGCTPDMGQVVLEAGTNTFFTQAQRDMFKIPTPGTIGNTGRNFFRNAPYLQTDVSLSRKFKFGERWAFDLRVDAKNVTNTPNFDYAFSNANLTLGDSRFGKVLDGVANNARRIQFSGKLSF